MAQQPEFELTYFNGRGLAETSRFIFAYTRTPYSDKRFPLEVIDFQKRKFKREEFEKAKAEGELVLSLGKVPFLKTQGITLSQSKSIERFLAKSLNCMGSTDLEAALIDAFCEHLRDLKTAYQEGKRTGRMGKFFEAELPSKLQALEQSLPYSSKQPLRSGATAALIGNAVSLADITLFSLVDFFDDKPKIIKTLESTPKLFASYQNLNNLPQIQEWMANRPSTLF